MEVSLSILLLRHVLQQQLSTSRDELRTTSRHTAFMCSAGSKGFCALKEMLQSGIPGNLLLIESGDFIHNISPSPPRHLSKVSANVADDNTTQSCSKTQSCDTCVNGGGGATTTTVLNSPPSQLCCELRNVGLNQHWGLDSSESNVAHVTIYTNSDVIPTSFLDGSRRLISIDLSPLANIMEIGEAFLMGCTSLKAIDLTPLSGVRVVKGAFLHSCKGLTTIDLSPLSQITTIHWGFMTWCTGLREIDLTPLSQATSIDNCFLELCSGLNSIDLSSFTKLKRVPRGLINNQRGEDTIVIMPDHLMGVEEEKRPVIKGRMKKMPKLL